MVSHTLRVMDWFPGRATLPQVALGAALLLAVTALSLYWAAGETSTGHRVFLWSIAALAFLLAVGRVVAGVRLVREGDARSR